MDKTTYTEKKKLHYTKPISLYIIFMLMGLVLALIDINYFQSPGFVVSALGISLLATGFAGILTSWIVAPQAASQMKDLIENSVGSPASFLAERRFLTELYMEKTKNAQQIDIIALSMQVFLEQYRKDDLIEWIVRQGKQFRLLILAPDASVTKLRGFEERINLDEKINTQVDILKELSEKIKIVIMDHGKCKGSLEVRFYDGIPYYAYFRADQEIIIGFYYSNLRGTESECLHIREIGNPVYKKLKSHFTALWDNTSKESVVIRIPDLDKT